MVEKGRTQDAARDCERGARVFARALVSAARVLCITEGVGHALEPGKKTAQIRREADCTTDARGVRNVRVPPDRRTPVVDPLAGDDARGQIGRNLIDLASPTACRHHDAVFRRSRQSASLNPVDRREFLRLWLSRRHPSQTLAPRPLRPFLFPKGAFRVCGERSRLFRSFSLLLALLSSDSASAFHRLQIFHAGLKMPQQKRKRGRRGKGGAEEPDLKRRKSADEGNGGVEHSKPEYVDAGDDSMDNAYPPVERPFFGMLDDEEQEHFKRADLTLEENQFENPEERDLFLAEVWREAAGKELKIAQSQSCSRLMERLIQLSKASQLKSLFQSFSGK